MSFLWPAWPRLFMWKCSKCGERHADHFSSCWKCAGMEAPPPTVQVAAAPTISCGGCHIPLSLVGAHHLRDTNKGDLLGALGGMFTDCERLDVHVCPRCGRVELFVEGLSRQLREEP